MLHVSSQSFVIFTFNMLLLNEKIFFQKSKRPLTQLPMSFSSIRCIDGYIFISPEINLWSDWWCFLAVSSHSSVALTFNMLLLNEKLFFWSQKDLRFIYLAMSFSSIRIMVGYILLACRVTSDVFFMFTVNNLLYLLLICYWVMENHFSEVKKTSDSFTYEIQ